MAKEKKIHLPDLPQDEYYEDLVREAKELIANNKS